MKKKKTIPTIVGKLADYCREHKISITELKEGVGLANEATLYDLNKKWGSKLLSIKTMESIYRFTSQKFGKENAIHPSMYLPDYEIFKK